MFSKITILVIMHSLKFPTSRKKLFCRTYFKNSKINGLFMKEFATVTHKLKCIYECGLSINDI